MPDKTSREIILEMIAGTNVDAPAWRAGMARAMELASSRMSTGDFETWCDGVADAILDA